ncbi:MAG: Rrf2 family transcriptional regulator [candidate division NC10 bacterium]|jgi:Rrf2 family protein
MHLSRESEYGLKAMIYLAQQPPATILTLNEIAESRDLPAGFLAKTFQKLTRHGLVQSFRGRRRGYCLAREASGISLRELLEAIEGPDLFQRCVFWGGRCGESNPCLLHVGWREIKPQLTEFLEGMTLAGLAQNENGGADAASV